MCDILIIVFKSDSIRAHLVMIIILPNGSLHWPNIVFFIYILFILFISCCIVYSNLTNTTYSRTYFILLIENIFFLTIRITGQV